MREVVAYTIRSRAENQSSRLGRSVEWGAKKPWVSRAPSTAASTKLSPLSKPQEGLEQTFADGYTHSQPAAPPPPQETMPKGTMYGDNPYGIGNSSVPSDVPPGTSKVLGPLPPQHPGALPADAAPSDGAGAAKSPARARAGDVARDVPFRRRTTFLTTLCPGDRLSDLDWNRPALWLPGSAKWPEEAIALLVEQYAPGIVLL